MATTNSQAAEVRYVSLSEAARQSQGRATDATEVRELCERFLPAAICRKPGKRDKVDVVAFLKWLDTRSFDKLRDQADLAEDWIEMKLEEEFGHAPTPRR